MLLHRAERKHWMDYPGETDIQRAARWIMVRLSGYQGCAERGFRVSHTHNISRDRMIELMFEVSRRLSSVLIECLPWQRVFDLYDRPQTVFFCDPPYVGDQSSYCYNFSEADHRELCERLHRLSGHWIFTYGDHPMIRDLYADCRIDEVHRIRTINQAKRCDYVELIIRP